jgi:hypothetical protein
MLSKGHTVTLFMKRIFNDDQTALKSKTLDEMLSRSAARFDFIDEPEKSTPRRRWLLGTCRRTCC